MIHIPNWDIPAGVKAFYTCRQQGHSVSPYASFNIAQHVGDDSHNVELNRCQLPQHDKIAWLQQVHGNKVVELKPGQLTNTAYVADASVTRGHAYVCAVMTADCLPVLFSSKDGQCVAAAHAGWRGLASGILEETIAKMKCHGSQLTAWLGPAIGASVFEVGDEVRQQFSTQEQNCFQPHGAKWLFDLKAAAKIRLEQAGLSSISVCQDCTYERHERYFSYRRDGQTGRMVSGIYLHNIHTK